MILLWAVAREWAESRAPTGRGAIRRCRAAAAAAAAAAAGVGARTRSGTAGGR